MQQTNFRRFLMPAVKLLMGAAIFFFYWKAFQNGYVGPLKEGENARRLSFLCTGGIILGITLFSLFGQRLFRRLPASVRLWAYRGFLFLSPFLLFLIVELPWNIKLSHFSLPHLPLNLLLYALLELLFANLCRNKTPGLFLLFVLGFFAGTANAFVLKFRGSPILATDLTAAPTALAVANQYQFTLDDRILQAGLLLYFVLVLLCLFSAEGLTASHGPIHLSLPKRPISLPHPLLSLLALLLLTVSINAVDFAASFGIPVNMYVPLITYRIAGFGPSLITFFQKMKVDKPKGYSEQAVEKILGSYADAGSKAGQATDDGASGQTDSGTGTSEQTAPAADAAKARPTEKPTIIAIMNESFSDLSVVGPFQCSAEHLAYLRSLKDDPGTVEFGHNYVSTYGGGTSTTEFEFLTGNSMSELQGTNPYGAFDLSGTPSMVNCLKQAGYTAIAMHPENPYNWRRKTVYPALGFDDFLSIDDFQGYERTVRNRISDRGDYEKLIDVYEEHKDSGTPLFLFNVTMQNHGEYDLSLIPKEQRVEIDAAYADQQDVRAYESLLHQSDEALRVLLNYFRQEDRPVLICFFGDHQPNLNDGFEEALSDSGKTEGESALITEERRRIVPYFIWSNYGVQPEDLKQDADGNTIMSTNYLGAKLQRYAGLPLSFYAEFLLEQREDIPVLNSLGYYGADGQWHSFSESDESGRNGSERQGEGNKAADKTEQTQSAVSGPDHNKDSHDSSTDGSGGAARSYAEWIHGYQIVEYNALFGKKRNEQYYIPGAEAS